MSYDLRPLSLGELLDRAFSLYRRYFWVFVGIMAVPSLAMMCLSLGTQYIQGVAELAPDQQPSSEMILPLVVGFAIVALFAFLFYWISYALALGATTVAVSEIYSGRVPSIAGAYGATRGKLGRLAWLMFLIGVRLFAVFVAASVCGALAGVVAAFLSPILSGLLIFLAVVVAFFVCGWMFLRYSVSVPAAVLEENTASESIARSIELTRGSLLRVVVLFAFTLIVTYAALMIFQVPFVIAAWFAGPKTTTALWLNMLGVLTGSIASALTGPLAVVAMAVLYYDVRIRKEGLDLELLVAGLRQTAPSTPSSSSSAVLPG